MIFVADSRWTYRSIGMAHDGAVKAAPIDRFGAATYAGNTDVGEAAIGWLTQEFARARSGEPVQDLCEVLRSAWRRYCRPHGDVLQFAFGFFAEGFVPVLMRLDSWNDFHPLEVVGITYLGQPTAIASFKGRLNAEVEKCGLNHQRDESLIRTHPIGLLSCSLSCGESVRTAFIRRWGARRCA